MVYVTAADTAPGGQTEDVTAEGYYYFDGSKWLPSSGYNIYNANGSLVGNGIRRTLNLNGKELSFLGSEQSSNWALNGGMYLYNEQSGTGRASLMMHGGNNSNLQIQQFYNSNTEIAVTGNSTGIAINTAFTSSPAPITFGTSSGGSNSVERMRIMGNGNTGMNTQFPTEKLDINGLLRVRSLPLNGATNAHHTISGDNASTTQNQTFTGTRTVVADANGVLGYVVGLPQTSSSGGTINIGETVARTYSIPNATAAPSTFRLGTYVTANSLPALPVVDGLEINIHGRTNNTYVPVIYNRASVSQLVSYQSFATVYNENKTSLNNTVTTGSFLSIDDNNSCDYSTSAAEVETTNLQVQVDANTYRWYEFKWWCMEVSGSKKIFLSIRRIA